MPKFIDRFMASQLRQPHGLFGSLVVTRVMNRVNQQITDRTIELLEVAPNHRVLEIGFGGGIGLARLARQLTDGVVTGVDFSDDMVAKAQRRFQNEIANGRVQIQLGDISRLPADDAAYDRVLTINTIYFWPDALAGMREIRRVLKPGGKLAIGIRSGEKMQKHSVTKYNFRLFSGSEVAEFMRAAGFVEVRIDHRDQDKWYDQVIVLGTRSS